MRFHAFWAASGAIFAPVQRPRGRIIKRARENVTSKAFFISEMRHDSRKLRPARDISFENRATFSISTHL
jgi:hypothetical protein